MIGIGVNIRPFLNKVARAAADYYNRITADGGVSESPECVNSGMSDLDRQNLLNSASLLLIPSGYKGGKLYSEIPTNGNGDLTWTRGSDAFRTNASGLLQRVPWNLLQRSEEFDNAVWTKFNATISSNVTTAPNGTLTAEKIIPTTTNASSHSIVQSITPATPITFSCYAKSAEYSKLMMFVVGTNKGYGFDLDTGTSFSVTGINNAVASQSITNVGNGWYRCSITISETTASRVDLYVLNSTSYGPNFSGDGTSGLFIWGAQVVEGTTAQTYLPTTDRLGFPRLDYTYGSCPSVLLEPQRTNVMLQNTSIDNSAWTKYNTTATADNIVSPDGTQNADKVTCTASTATRHGVFNASGLNVSGSVGDLWTYSVFVKKGNLDWVFIDHYQGSNNFTWFNIANGTIGTVGSGATAKIENYGNGWYRLSVTKGITNTGGNYLGIYLTNANGVDSFTATGSEYGYIWGSQMEYGSYQSTLIYTTSASVTRVADSFSRSNIYTNGLISASGGTWFVEFKNNIAMPRVSGYPTLFISSNIAGSSTLTFGISSQVSAYRLSLYSWISGTFTNIGTTSTDNLKVAFAFTTTTLKVFVNGSVFASYTGLTIDPTTIQNLIGNAEVTMFIQQMALFNSALTDTQCQTLTTL